ncbi:hypothetical protein MASR2M8_10490 [Opitutaceae bacterium]
MRAEPLHLQTLLTMFRRLLLDNWMAIFTLSAFITALSVYVLIAYRALRMPRLQRDALARMPFTDDSNATRHE